MRIELQQICQVYHGQLLFNIDDLGWESGDSIHLYGANGSGKSTLMKIMAKLLKPTRGQVRYLSHESQTKGSVIYLHQHAYLFDTTVRGNLEYGLRLQGQADDARVDDILEWTGLTALQQRSVHNLSGGERQRLAMGRALTLRPQMLLLDEPTSNLDANSLERIISILRHLQQQGTGLMLACHQSSTLVQLCHQHWHLINGAVQAYAGGDNEHE